MHSSDEQDGSGTQSAKLGNDFGLSEALLGLAAGFVLSIVATSAFDNVSGHPHVPSTYGQDIVSLFGLWVGLIGACVLTLSSKRSGRSLRSTMAQRYGFSIRPLIDLPLGIAVGVASQFVLVPLLDLPLLPFVPNLSKRLGQPAHALTNHVSGGGLVVLGLLVCLGSPIVEELFFRGLLLRGLLGRLHGARQWIGPASSVLITGILFGLVHFEALQLVALVGFGTVLGALAYRSGRLGPGIVAHIAFNSTTFIALAWSR